MHAFARACFDAAPSPNTPSAQPAPLARAHLSPSTLRAPQLADGKVQIYALAPARLAVRILASVLRLTVACFMFYQGSVFLCYTIDLGDLLMNAVALEFVVRETARNRLPHERVPNESSS